MHIVLLGNKDANDLKTWSGVPRNITDNLKRCGHKVTTIQSIDSSSLLSGRTKRSWYRETLGTNYVPVRDPAVARLLGKCATERLLEVDRPDAVIVWHPTDAAFLETDAPVILVHDVTWHQLIDFYPAYERKKLASETLNGGFEVDRRAFERCDHVLLSSSWAQNSVVRDYGVPEEKVSVQPFGSNAANIPDEIEIARWREKRCSGNCTLLFVGVDWPRKGGALALEITRYLRVCGLMANLQIVGCTPPGPMPDFAHCSGLVTRSTSDGAAKLERLFLEADFLLLPSTADCSPVVISEAAAYGLPVAARSVGGIAELLGQSGWGMAAPVDSPASDYAKWIERAFVDRSSYLTMSRIARNQYDSKFNWTAFVRKLVGIIASLRKPPGTPQSEKE
jgi:glycosyltransferase involved in cell wall biosynthesis